MHWTSKRRPQAYVAAVLAATLSSAAIAAPLVVRSAGPSAKSYPVGKAVAGDKIVLKAGDTVVLLDGKSTRTLSGPGTFNAVETKTAAAGSTLGALMAGGGEKRARIGAVRSVKGDDGTKNPSVWYVDMNRSSSMCVIDPANVTIWRKDATAEALVTVTAANGASSPIKFGPGQAKAAWPTAVPITDGGAYKISWDGAKAPTNLKFSVIAPPSNDPQVMVTTFKKAGCDAQLNQVTQTAEAKPTPKG
ncbi:hypothetical protein [Sphingomonas montanisoli]|uniref:Uncharacterized protein n=1 Tax=Sphingomonas montanisoli TaxID=2606412 RepID=A0A5D9C0S1_9SPHN|nr:hypothetical protein [Sphingomonas montanisoli]TZG24620.1 hypothetical protein FYJ91_18525 [Sphingomonas montanisoli]